MTLFYIVQKKKHINKAIKITEDKRGYAIVVGDYILMGFLY